jgi:SAM-dependent methyltransferase
LGLEEALVAQQNPETEERTVRWFYQLGYRFFRMPWETGPRGELVELVEGGNIPPCRAIDLGCGTGSNAIFLARHGFDVTGVDFASSAIAKARRRAEEAGVPVEFVVDDLTSLRKVEGPFEFLLDYGTMDDLVPQHRNLYTENVVRLSQPGSKYLLWCHEWPARWYERLLLPVCGGVALEPGEARRRFDPYFEMERIAGTIEYDFSQFPPGFAAYLMTRKPMRGCSWSKFDGPRDYYSSLRTMFAWRMRAARQLT